MSSMGYLMVVVFLVCLTQYHQVSADFDESFPEEFLKTFNKMRRQATSSDRYDVTINDELTNAARKWAPYLYRSGQTEALWSGNSELHSWGWKDKTPEELVSQWMGNEEARKAMTSLDVTKIGMAKYYNPRKGPKKLWLIELAK